MYIFQVEMTWGPSVLAAIRLWGLDGLHGLPATGIHYIMAASLPKPKWKLDKAQSVDHYNE